ncbi:class I SAM-dependent methyltransferase [Streptomyces sp. NPDC005438]|uniref:class I SAM-dependent methyltransferase n=1 Tax=Streptomyces sp. NPDC005438 TaxID=3156880 RepID=UPI0033B23150
MTTVPDPPPYQDDSRTLAALESLDRISLAAIHAELTGSRALDDQPADLDTVCARLRVQDRHRWLVRRWLTALTSRRLAHHTPDGHWTRTDTTPPLEDLGALPTVYAAAGFDQRMAGFHQNVLSRLGPLLRGEEDVQRHFFGEGEVVSALRSYQDGTVSRHLNTLAGRTLSRLPADGPPHVVELGAGVGLATRAALDALGDRPVSYLVTDVSPLFSEVLRDRFGPRLAGYTHLDINRPRPATVPAGHADVVLAGNVLHNAVDLPRSLALVGELLRPGGSLLFTESDRERPAILTSLMFLLSSPPGAPRAGSRDRRAPADRTFLTVDEWREELHDAGLTPLRVTPSPGDRYAGCGQILVHARKEP